MHTFNKILKKYGLKIHNLDDATVKRMIIERELHLGEISRKQLTSELLTIVSWKFGEVHINNNEKFKKMFETDKMENKICDYFLDNVSFHINDRDTNHILFSTVKKALDIRNVIENQEKGIGEQWEEFHQEYLVKKVFQPEEARRQFKAKIEKETTNWLFELEEIDAFKKLEKELLTSILELFEKAKNEVKTVE